MTTSALTGAGRGVSLIHDLVRTGRITAGQGAELLAFRRLLAWSRRPWWERAVLVMLGGGV